MIDILVIKNAIRTRFSLLFSGKVIRLQFFISDETLFRMNDSPIFDPILKKSYIDFS